MQTLKYYYIYINGIILYSMNINNIKNQIKILKFNNIYTKQISMLCSALSYCDNYSLASFPIRKIRLRRDSMTI